MSGSYSELPEHLEVSVVVEKEDGFWKAYAPTCEHDYVGIGDTPSEALSVYWEDVEMEEVWHRE